MVGYALILLLATIGGSSALDCVCGATLYGSSVNVRDQPTSSGSQILGEISPGQCHEVIGQSSGIWRNIDFKGEDAWVLGKYVSGPQTCGGSTSATCIAKVCGSKNAKRTCDKYGCGNFGASRGTRRGKDRTHEGWDLQCSAGDDVYAPFAGKLVRKARPYTGGRCCNTGLELRGSGFFEGHKVKLFYCEPIASLIGKRVNKGQKIADHVGLHCNSNECYDSSMTDHVHYQLDLKGVRVDPASWIFC